MKFYLFLWGLFVSLTGLSQTLYDPTVINDEVGSGKLFDITEVYDLHVEFYNSSYHSILTDRWFAKDESRLPAQLDMGPGMHYDSVGIKYKGNSTFYIADLLGNPKVPYNIDINYYVGGQKWLGYKKLKLANVLFDPTFTKEAVASHVYRHYLPTPQVSLIRLTVNGTYLGCYANTEAINKQFMKKHFGEKDGTRVKCEPIAQFGSSDEFVPADLVYEGTDTMDYYESYEIKSDSVDKSWDEFIEFMDVLNNDPTNVDQYLNVDRLLWYFAVTTVLPNEDAYNTMVMHNYYMYKTEDGRFQIIPWDMSETFCGAMIGQLTYADHYERDPAYGYTPLLVDHPLVYRILSQPYYFKKFMHHVRTVIDEFYDQTQLKNWALDLQDDAYDAVNEDPNNLFTMSDFVDNLDNNMMWFTTEIAAMIETMDNRKPYLESHPEVTKVPPEIVSVSQNIENPGSADVVYISAEVTGADNVYLKVTNNDASYAADYTQVEMLDDGMGGDASAGDNIYTASVPFNTSNEHIKYYVEAQNTDALAQKPERAEYYFYHYYVDQVVSVNNPGTHSISVFPNPTTKWLNVQSSNSLLEIYIFDLSGRLIDSFPGSTQKIDCRNYKKGTYILVGKTQKGKTTKRFIVR